MNSILTPKISQIFRCLPTLCELTPCRCSVGKPWNSCRTLQTSSRFMWWGMKSSFSPIIRPDSTCVRTMWSIQSQLQTQASFVRMLTGTNNLRTHTEYITIKEATACVSCGFYKSHTSAHIQYSFTLYSTHTCLQYRLPSHTLTTYCLASKAYVGWPRVLFMSSLW